MLEFVVSAGAQSEPLGYDLHPILKEINDHGQQRAEMEGDIEVERFNLPPEKPGSEVQMRAAADGQEFGKALDQRQNYNLN